MPPDGENRLEQVKRELRAILISEKHGVSLKNIENDYEMLSCNRLPYRDLGFKDLSSFMRSIPDVARENRSPTGEITYLAVCDETTAHIQRLVSNQKSKVKKRPFSTRGRGGRGFRGGVREGRGGRGSFPKPSGTFHRPVSTFTAPTRPRLPQSARGGGSWKRGIPRVSPVADPSLRVSGDIRNRGATNTGFSTFITGRRNNAKSGDDDQWEEAFDSTFNQTDSFTDRDSENDWDKENQSSSPFIHNFKIGVDKKGERTIHKGDYADLREYLNNKTSRTVSNSEDEDLRVFLDSRRNGDYDKSKSVASSRGAGHVSLEKDSHESVPERKGNILSKQLKDIVRQHISSDTVLRRPHKKNFTKTNTKDLPPRFLKQLESQKQEGSGRPDVKAERISPIQHTETYDSTTVFYAIESKNWVPPENGAHYLQAFHEYFVQRGNPEPPINVVAGKADNEKGFYGQIHYDNQLYYPLEILRTEQEARQNAARAFCLKMGITIHNKDSHLPQPVAPSSSQPSPSSTALSETVKKKIYDMMSETGIHAKGLPALYKQTYHEDLRPDFLQSLQQATHLFNIEQTVPNHFIIYKVPEAMVRMAQVHMEGKKQEEAPHPVLPVLPDVGTELRVIFSYSYSADEIYVQRAEHEDLLYQIDEALQTLAKHRPPSSTDSLTCSTLIAACYEEGWYRARVITVEQEKVSVSFVDYGNREQVTRSDVRFLPDEKLVKATAPLAIPCSLHQPHPNVQWRDDISEFFFSLSETDPILSAKVMGHRENTCVIELMLLNGESVTSKLTLSQPAAPSPALPTAHSPAPSPALPAATSSSPPSLPSPPSSTFSSPTTSAVASLSSPHSQPSGATHKTAAVKLFADDPDPLCLPDSMFAVFICRVLSESSVLLRVVDEEYSDKLDELECRIADAFNSWPEPKKVHPSNVYACVVLSNENEEEEEEDGEDGKKYFRVRVLRQFEKDNTYECYLLDHGDHETVTKDQLREIDSTLNSSLSYQAILASLHGLDTLPSEHRGIATEILIKLIITDCTTFMAKRQAEDNVNGDDSKKTDPIIVNRVRKIISCMNEVDPSKVVDIYTKVYGQTVDNVEEVIKQIPGYGFWKKSLEVELVDTSQEEDISINQTILSIISEVKQLQAQGHDTRAVFQEIFGSSGSPSVDEATVASDGKNAGELPSSHIRGGTCLSDIQKLADSVNQQLNLVAAGMEGGGVTDRVESYVQQQADSLAVADTASSQQASGNLYTWSTNVDNVKEADWLSSKRTPDLGTVKADRRIMGDGGGDGSLPALPPWYGFELNNFSALFILQVESPSDFVAIPYDMRQPLNELETEMLNHFSKPQKIAEVLSTNRLYAVNREGLWHRTLYISSIEHLHRVFYPDYHQFDTVTLDQLFPLPPELYSLPFLGRKMALGAIAPNSQDWPESVKFWFIQATKHKAMYGLIWDSQQDNNKDDHLPGPLTAQLVDTSGEEDVILDDVLCEKGWAKHVQLE